MLSSNNEVKAFDKTQDNPSEIHNFHMHTFEHICVRSHMYICVAHLQHIHEYTKKPTTKDERYILAGDMTSDCNKQNNFDKRMKLQKQRRLHVHLYFVGNGTGLACEGYLPWLLWRHWACSLWPTGHPNNGRVGCLFPVETLNAVVNVVIVKVDSAFRRCPLAQSWMTIHAWWIQFTIQTSQDELSTGKQVLLIDLLITTAKFIHNLQDASCLLLNIQASWPFTPNCLPLDLG